MRKMFSALSLLLAIVGSSPASAQSQPVDDAELQQPPAEFDFTHCNAPVSKAGCMGMDYAYGLACAIEAKDNPGIRAWAVMAATEAWAMQGLESTEAASAFVDAYSLANDRWFLDQLDCRSAEARPEHLRWYRERSTAVP